MGIASGIATTAAPGGTTTTDATAEQWHILSGKTAYIVAGKVTGTGYFPAMMQYDGSTSYFLKSAVTTSGTKITWVGQFSTSPLTAVQILTYILKSAAALYVSVVASNDANNPNKLQIRCQNSSGTTICHIFSDISVTDGEEYTAFFEYDGDAGTATLRINGADADNTGATGRVLTTGTLDVGASSEVAVGASNGGTGKFAGNIGFVGLRFVGGLTWSDFMQTDGSPKQLDESGWTEWGAQPLVWNEHGDLSDNKGSLGAFTRNGAIVVAPIA